MCGHRHGVVTFLEHESMGGVDRDFWKLVKAMHYIPFCASFGVSCSGHFYESDASDRWHPNSFNPSPWGHLDMIVLADQPHIQELLRLMSGVIGEFPGATFQKIDHVFGPPKTSQLEVWEIRVHDNGCLGELKEKFLNCGWVPKAGNEQLYQVSKKRCDDVKLFWEQLASRLIGFCREHGFEEKFALDKRVEELVAVWRLAVEPKE